MWMDKDFDNQFFTLDSTEVIKDKDTIKLVRQEEPTVVLTFDLENPEAAAQEEGPSTSSPASSPASSSSTVVLSESPYRSQQWPAEFVTPTFSKLVEQVLGAANDSYARDGTLLNNPSLNSDVLETLAEEIFAYTAYPTGLQIHAVAEALLNTQ